MMYIRILSLIDKKLNLIIITIYETSFAEFSHEGLISDSIINVFVKIFSLYLQKPSEKLS